MAEGRHNLFGVPETVAQFILYCTKHRFQRRKFRLRVKAEKLRTNLNDVNVLLDDPKVFPYLAQFILETGTLRQGFPRWGYFKISPRIFLQYPVPLCEGTSPKYLDWNYPRNLFDSGGPWEILVMSTGSYVSKYLQDIAVAELIEHSVASKRVVLGTVQKALVAMQTKA
ncbi:hypothetical protein CROQUDRAFT_101498 [Cronartium quercuum f. sp. fusiforme G11]|uniref:Uncharacterized protein n=1 Tax=Cronartium quercuum f. sp. fusiforme G11 TaxID=708437 RepID=A0A9P6N5B7_9BASI|nr:hypothetical protein CROQUDRAFT_101498 [Cronartium quercuum f. sp. fusiforme G11]